MRIGERLVLPRTGETLVRDLSTATNFLDSFLGLMGRAGLADGAGLLLPNCRGIHTCFMRFAIDVVYLDREFRVCKVVPTLRPWRASACKDAAHTLEVAADASTVWTLQLGDVLEVRRA